MDKSNSIVIDNGTGNTKIGYSDTENPAAIFPTVVGLFDDDYHTGREQLTQKLIGTNALENSEHVDLTFPVERGHVKDVEAMEKIWKHGFQDLLQVDAEEHEVLLSEPTNAISSLREEQIKLFFEEFRVKGYSVYN